MPLDPAVIQECFKGTQDVFVKVAAFVADTEQRQQKQAAAADRFAAAARATLTRLVKEGSVEPDEVEKIALQLTDDPSLVFRLTEGLLAATKQAANGGPAGDMDKVADVADDDQKDPFWAARNLVLTGDPSGKRQQGSQTLW